MRERWNGEAGEDNQRIKCHAFVALHPMRSPLAGEGEQRGLVRSLRFAIPPVSAVSHRAFLGFFPRSIARPAVERRDRASGFDDVFAPDEANLPAVFARSSIGHREPRHYAAGRVAGNLSAWARTKRRAVEPSRARRFDSELSRGGSRVRVTDRLHGGPFVRAIGAAPVQRQSPRERPGWQASPIRAHDSEGTAVGRLD
jgi:hypothetical protein